MEPAPDGNDGRHTERRVGDEVVGVLCSVAAQDPGLAAAVCDAVRDAQDPAGTGLAVLARLEAGVRSGVLPLDDSALVMGCAVLVDARRWAEIADWLGRRRTG